MNYRIIKFLAFIFLAYYLPVILILAHVIPFEFRFHVLVAMAFVMAVYAFGSKHSLKDLGFRFDTLKASLLWNGALSALFVILMIALYMANLIREPVVPAWTWFYLFYVFVSSPTQEFIYRSVIFSEMSRAGIESPLLQVTLSAVTFCFLHVVYRDGITLAVTLFMGIVWGMIYYKHPNFWGVTISHAVLGIVSIATGLI
jgi:membrane protease YdiL (CAAX protease family)